MLNETINEVSDRMNKVRDTIIHSNEYDYDKLFSQGNTIRRILEYILKFFCLYEEIEVKIDGKYGNVKLSELRKAIKSICRNLLLLKGLLILQMNYHMIREKYLVKKKSVILE